ncbi:MULTISPECIES: hypothetical protein [Frankia]|uniref:Uncharacterized protein n=1 Tax=Frankia alni (strain DSM 45986 / CECT 9034 / ACN14a) TaxID=326424 RepID=Q0RSF1_FRAAA|nr:MULTISPECIES: hypothetical protein [Frankia]CAJ59512.1 hypothetical protein; putative signal peptide [Frankia alni ACN14a]
MTEGKPYPGYPAGPRPQLAPGVAALLAAALFLLVVGGGYLVARTTGVIGGGSGRTATPSAAPVAAVPSGASGSGGRGGSSAVPALPGFATPAPLTRTPVPPATSTPDEIALLSETRADAVLTQQAALDRPRVEALRGWWVPQVSSKCVGLQVDIEPDWTPDGTPDVPSVTEAQIAAFHVALQQRYRTLTTRQTTLGIDGDFATKGPCSGRMVWISIVPQGFSSAAGANQWCTDRNIPLVECDARLVAPGGDSYQVPRG